MTATAGAWVHASPRDVRNNYDEYRVAMGDWLESLGKWQWFVTGTLDPSRVTAGFTKPGIGSARAMLRYLLAETFATSFVAVFELHKSGVPHLHALLGGCPSIRADAAEAAMSKEYGHSRWKVYKEGGGAAGYVGKYLVKEEIELYIGTNGPWSIEELVGQGLAKLRV